jgi:hypothetical protein
MVQISNCTKEQMTDTEKLQFLLSKLQHNSDIKHCFDKYGDGYSPCENGNYDDAFDDGELYGAVEFARALLQQLKLQTQIAPHLNND